MTTRKLTYAALIAAVYASVTLVQTILFPSLAFGPIQVRFAEALTILPMLIFEAVPGLFVGCLLANIIGVAFGATTVIDIAVGPAATLIAALLTYKFGKRLWLAPLPPVLVNALIIGMMLAIVYTPDAVWASFPLMAGEVAVGQSLACYGLGIPLVLALKKTGLIKA